MFPKKGLLKIKGELPSNVSFNEETGYFEEDSNIFWKSSNINSTDIISSIDNILPRANWFKNDGISFIWKIENELIDNDAWICLDDNKEFIKQFSFRIDLRNSNIIFLTKMLNIAEEYDLLLNDYSGKIFEPKLNDILSFIKSLPYYNIYFTD
jgi:hypothetical protein